MYISFGDTSRKAELGDVVELQGQVQDVVECEESGVLMLNIDADELKIGDLKFIKALGLTISNPETEDPIALEVELKKNRNLASALASYLALSTISSNDDDDDDDSSFFSSGGGFLGSSSFGGFGGGFGGFGGGGFSGGGASRGF